MRKWQDLAAPDDPGSWYAVGNMWPTKRGDYETGYVSAKYGDVTFTGASTVLYSFGHYGTNGTTRQYIVSGSKVWEVTGSTSATDRTSALVIGGVGEIMMAQYGNGLIMTNGTANSVAFLTPGSGGVGISAPASKIVCVQSNAVLVFNTASTADTWAASDVGDYTNWSTGEYATGRLIATPGPITAAVTYGNDVYVFKHDAIYRMTYVGGSVKWQSQIAYAGSGVKSFTGAYTQYQAVSTPYGVCYLDGEKVMLFDGSSRPRQLNPLTTVATVGGVTACTFIYGQDRNNLYVCPNEGAVASTGTPYYIYNFDSDAWGASFGCADESNSGGVGIVQGAWDKQENGQHRPMYWAYRSVTDKLTLSTRALPSNCYLQTSKLGDSDFKSSFSRVTPQLRRRSDLGTDSASLEMTLFREREDTTATTTRTISESTTRKRFDLQGGAAADNFARFKVTWTALDVEVDDFKVMSKPAGTD